MTEPNRNLRLAVDLITLYDPPFWQVGGFNEFYDNTILPPERFWDKALDTLAETGIEGVEITFGPGHWRNALARYGSPENFAAALRERSLSLCSGFYTGLVLDGDWRPKERQAAILEEISQYADFVRQAGADIIVAGLPMRRSWDASDPLFVDLDHTKGLADLLNRMGYECLRRGVRLAIHPETHAIFWLRRDVDLMLLLTDPVYVFFCPDTAHLTLGGSDPSELYSYHRSRVALTHWKDAKGRVPIRHPIDENIFRSHHPYFCRVGTGEVNWGGWIRALRDSAYQGWAVLELDAASNPKETIVAAREFVQTSLLPVYS